MRFYSLILFFISLFAFGQSQHVDSLGGWGNQKNFIKYGDFEKGIAVWKGLSGFSGSTCSPVDGDTMTIANDYSSLDYLFSTVDGTSISGASSGYLRGSSLNSFQQGISYDFKLSTAFSKYFSKNLLIKFDYRETGNPLLEDRNNTGGSGGTLSSFRVVVASDDNDDFTSPKYHYPATSDLKVGQSPYVSSFITDATDRFYRLILFRCDTTAWSTADSLRVDDFFIGEQQQAGDAAAISEWKSYNPSVSSIMNLSLAIISGQYRRNGDSIDIRISGTFNSGSPGGNFQISEADWLPPGLSIETSKLLDSGQQPGFGTTGTATADDASASSSGDMTGGIPFIATSGDLFVQSTGNDIWDAAEPFAWGSTVNDTFTIHLTGVPIQGWQSTAKIVSADYSNTSIEVDARRDSGQGFATGDRDVIFNEELRDNHGIYNPSTGEVTMPRNDFCIGVGAVDIDQDGGSQSSDDSVNIELYINGSNAGKDLTKHLHYTGTNQNTTQSFAFGGFFKTGDVIKIRAREIVMTRPWEPEVNSHWSFYCGGDGKTILGGSPRKYQTKILPSDVTSNTSDIASMRFENLEIGKSYKVVGQALFQSRGGDDTIVSIEHDGQIIARTIHENNTDGSGGDGHQNGFSSPIFKATATTIEFNVSGVVDANSQVNGNGTLSETWHQIIEMGNVIETDQF